MNIIVDTISETVATDLGYAMHLLFEKRLGHTLYFIVGDEWVDKGYYLHVDPPTSKFLLSLSTGYMPKYDWHYKTLTYQKFLKIKETIGATLSLVECADHGPFHQLIKEQIPHAKRIRHIGNPGEVLYSAGEGPSLFDCSRNIIFSITPDDTTCHLFTKKVIEEGRNYVFAHQEFETRTFKFVKPFNFTSITGFQHDLCELKSYTNIWQPIRDLLPDFKWKFHGRSGVDGNILDINDLAQAFIDTSFVLQLKKAEDGGGHLTHNAFGVGRPLICKKSWYGGLMLDMLIDGVTCIDLDARKDPRENAEFIRYCSQPDKLKVMSRNVYQMFDTHCDYKKEAQDVKAFLSNLQGF